MLEASVLSEAFTLMKYLKGYEKVTEELDKCADAHKSKTIRDLLERLRVERETILGYDPPPKVESSVAQLVPPIQPSTEDEDLGKDVDLTPLPSVFSHSDVWVPSWWKKAKWITIVTFIVFITYQVLRNL